MFICIEGILVTAASQITLKLSQNKSHHLFSLAISSGQEPVSSLTGQFRLKVFHEMQSSEGLPGTGGSTSWWLTSGWKGASVRVSVRHDRYLSP